MTAIQLHRFHGGLHLADNKAQSTTRPITAAPLPKRLFVPVLQHAGPAAEPCVQVGDYVYKGQPIAQSTAALSVPVHAPSSGTIRAITSMPYPHPSGEPCLGIEIETDGKKQWLDSISGHDYQQLENTEILRLIEQAGIAGMGGAGFPTITKLKGHKKIRHLIINGSECEPYITADDMLMRERAERVMNGIDIMAQLVCPEQVLIAIEDNKPEAIASMQSALAGRDYQIISIPTLYPSGGERQLIKILTGQEVPSGGLPIDLGIICQNCATAAAISDAIVHGRPLISRIVTLTGAALSTPMNIECLIGTPISDVLELAGIQDSELQQLIIGGPMMGFVLPQRDAPIIKTTNCIIAAAKNELAYADTLNQAQPSTVPTRPCIRCGECELVCPSNLLPQQLMFFAKGEQHEQLLTHNLFDCIECGCCSYVCPSNIPLVQYYRAAKSDIRDARKKQIKSEQAKQRYELRLERLRLEEEKKAAERQARNERLARIKAEQEQTQQSEPVAGNANDAELKRLKIAASMAQVALKKAEKQLAQHGGEALETQVEALKVAAQQAQAALKAAEQATAAPAVKAVPSAAEAELKKAKIQLAMHKAALKKAERAEASPEQIATLQQAIQDAEQHLNALTQSNVSAKSE